jgi:hypothetical protein
MSCESSYGCKLKLQDTRDSCWGTVMVNCGGELDFYYGPNGEFEYRVYSNRRDLMMEAGPVEAGAVELLSTSTRGGATNAGGSFSLEEAVKDVVTTTTTTTKSSSGSSLRGGATGSKRTL